MATIKINIMIRVLSLLAFLLFSIFVTAQVSENRSIPEFTKIRVRSGVELTFTQDAYNTIKVEADDTVKLTDVVTKVIGNTLEIYVESKNYSNNNRKNKKKLNHKILRVAVSSPLVDEFKAGSSSKIILKNGVTSKKIILDISSSGTLIGNIKADELTIDLSSSGTIESNIATAKLEARLSSSSEAILSGNADSAEIKTSSSATFNGKKVTSKTAKIESSSSSSVSLIVTANLDAKASSSASIDYYGNPQKVEVEKSSSGSVSKK